MTTLLPWLCPVATLALGFYLGALGAGMLEVRRVWPTWLAWLLTLTVAPAYASALLVGRGWCWVEGGFGGWVGDRGQRR